MTDETHITGIEKIGNGTHHAMQIKGVVHGKPVEGLVNVDAFHAKEREGQQALREYLKDGLGAIHEQEQGRRR